MVRKTRISKEILKHSKGVHSKLEAIKRCQTFIWNHRWTFQRARIHGIKNLNRRERLLLKLSIRDNQAIILPGAVNNKKLHQPALTLPGEAKLLKILSLVAFNGEASKWTQQDKKDHVLAPNYKWKTTKTPLRTLEELATKIEKKTTKSTG